jgi:hypothetical protein
VAKANTITLGTGRTLTLHALAQELTYEGLLEGVPTTKFNESLMNGVVKRQRTTGPSISVHLVAPVETPIDMGHSYMSSFGEPARLPSVTCIGRFRSEPIAKEGSGWYSELTIVWFQSEFAMPFEPRVLEEIIRLDWDALAADDSDW